MKKIKELIIKKIFMNTVNVFFTRFCKGIINNQHNLIKEPSLLAFNHVSYMDWLIVFCVFYKKLNIKIIFIGKKRLFKHCLFKHLMEFGNVICVDQDNVDKEFLVKVRKSLKEGQILGIFPEGKRTEDGKLIKAQNGITRLAIMNKVPIIPVGLNGFYEILPKGKKIPRINRASIDIGKPIYLDKYYGKKIRDVEAENITRELMSKIGKLTNQNYNY